jgi:hypothetical protein
MRRWARGERGVRILTLSSSRSEATREGPVRKPSNRTPRRELAAKTALRQAAAQSLFPIGRR